MSSKFGFIVSTHVQIIELILQNLPSKDLISASLVCKNWNSAANIIRRNRSVLAVTSYSCSNDAEIADDDIFKKIVNRDQLPALCLCFMKFNLFHRYNEYLNSTSEIKNNQVLNQLQKSLPPNCKSLFLAGSSFPQDHQKYEPEGVKVMNVLFPEIRGVKMQEFQMDINENLEEFIKQFSNKNLKFIIIFGYSAQAKLTMDKIIIHLREKYIKFSVGAILLENYSQTHPNFIQGVAFYGDNLHANVITLPTMIHTRDEIENSIVTLKHDQFEIQAGKSLILMFPERQRRFAHLDLEVLRDFFPSTEIAGLTAVDVLSLSEDPERQEQLTSFIRHWQVPERPIVCDKRFNGPGQIVLLSWQV